MNKKLKNICREIMNDQNPGENIPAFLEMAAEKYYNAATVRLALNYFNFYETSRDDYNSWSSQFLADLERFNKLLPDIFSDNNLSAGYKNYIKEVSEIRNCVLSRNNSLNAYASLFENYEYALNRVEYRFKKMGKLDDDETIAGTIINFIFDTDNDVVINERIKDVIGQLPIRITKQKYFEYVKKGFDEIIKETEESFYTVMNMVRRSAMLDFPEDGKDLYPELWDKKSCLEKLDFINITKEEYKAATEVISQAVTLLKTESFVYYELLDLINSLYTILICAPYKGEKTLQERKQEEAAFYIINGINRAFFRDKHDDDMDITEEVIEKFKLLENAYEETAEFELSDIEDALLHINRYHKDAAENLAEKNLFITLLFSKDLLSGNTLLDSGVNTAGSADKERFNNEVDKLIKDLTDKFQKCDRMLIRAIMANTINKMPVFFDNISEIIDYVHYSLNNCSDMAEKYACVELLNEIMDYQ